MASDYKNYPLGGANKHLLEVKNKQPAAVQITAEQLLREAVDRQLVDATMHKPQQRIADAAELNEYRVNKRKEFEDLVRRQRHHMGNWIKYATWEAGQKEFKRARSVFERALLVDYQNVSLWLKYIEMEASNKFVMSCRNLYERACQLLPRVEQFWFKYAHMEELLGNYAGARTIYERWMDWNPSDKGWMLYIHFEERCKELDRSRRVFENYLSNRPSQTAFLRFTKFEERHHNIPRARAGYEKAVELLPLDMLDQQFFIKFAKFEERQGEMERANSVYQQALHRLKRSQSEDLYDAYVAFQKQYGDQEALEDTVMNKRRFAYEEAIAATPHNYDAWIDYIRLEETSKDIVRTRNVYERAIANIPTVQDKRAWTRYVYIWLSYALFEELVAHDTEQCRKVYTALIELIPHEKFSFAKVWNMFVAFEIRQLDLERARRIYGMAIAKCGKPRIFSAYADLELRLGNIDRCRRIYAKYIELYPLNPKAWIALIDLEIMAEEKDRARAVCEMAINMEQMDMPELIWKAYIDMEIGWNEFDAVRDLYERLLQKSQHLNIFKGFAAFEWNVAENRNRAREVIKRGIDTYRTNGWDEERAAIIDHWLDLEREGGDEAQIRKVFAMLPSKVKRRKIEKSDAGDENIVEVTTYVFPDDDKNSSNLKILHAAKLWKQKQAEKKTAEDA